jgi:hypothetical protein
MTPSFRNHHLDDLEEEFIKENGGVKGYSLLRLRKKIVDDKP